MQMISSPTVQKTSHASRAILAATAGVALLGLLAAALSTSTAVRSRVTSPTMATGLAGGIVAPPDTMEIVPAAVMDRRAERFVGTGDGSAGSWVP
jgi:hypothetical protein